MPAIVKWSGKKEETDMVNAVKCWKLRTQDEGYMKVLLLQSTTVGTLFKV